MCDETKAKAAYMLDCMLAYVLDCMLAYMLDCMLAYMLDCMLAYVLDCMLAYILDCMLAYVLDCMLAYMLDSHVRMCTSLCFLCYTKRRASIRVDNATCNLLFFSLFFSPLRFSIVNTNLFREHDHFVLVT